MRGASWFYMVMWKSYEIMLPGFTGCSVVVMEMVLSFVLLSHICVKFLLKSLCYQQMLVFLQHENPPSLSTMLKCAGRFVFLLYCLFVNRLVDNLLVCSVCEFWPFLLLKRLLYKSPEFTVIGQLPFTSKRRKQIRKFVIPLLFGHIFR